MNIEIKPAPDNESGHKHIMVDGVRWGEIFREGSGRTTRYWFKQDNGTALYEPGEEKKKYSKEIDVRPESRRHRYSWDKSAPPRPTHDLLLEKVTDLINRGILIHPKKKELQNKLANERFRKNCEREKREKRQRDLHVANTLIGKYVDSLRTDSESFADAIADAIEHGRSQ